ncbi:MBL fold metallo-hydrolase [Paenibacillus sp. GCM10023252]|uniref:MBL fold metallo-hydrolase n=1 Tax=Paenibacillus sp. GCM10023252 TaxID=3252649 RepID=UPI00360DE44E
MRTIQEGSLYQLTFMPRLFPVNCYLIEEEKELTLIDAALPYSWKGIVAAAGAIGKPITRIVLTHAHDDHVGSLDRLKQLLPQAQVYLSARDNRLLQGDLSLDEGESQGKIKGSVPKKLSTRPDVLLQGGENIGSLLTVPSPGHTPGSMSFYHSRTGHLMAGDAFQTRGGIAVSGHMQPLFPFPAMATWDAASAISSAKQLLELRPSLLAVGHGELVRAPQYALITAITRAERSLLRRGVNSIVS